MARIPRIVFFNLKIVLFFNSYVTHSVYILILNLDKFFSNVTVIELVRYYYIKFVSSTITKTKY